VAVIRYRYSAEPMKLEDRFVNPLGFQVIKYRKDPEALALPAPASAPKVEPTVTSSASPAPGSSYYGGPPVSPPAEQGAGR
jgi:type IV secretion system protein VirB8